VNGESSAPVSTQGISDLQASPPLGDIFEIYLRGINF